MCFHFLLGIITIVMDESPKTRYFQGGALGLINRVFKSVTKRWIILVEELFCIEVSLPFTNGPSLY